MLVFVFLVGILFGYLICEEVQKSFADVQADRTEYIDFVELQEIVRRMDETSRKLQVIDRLLLDMELSGDSGQAVKIVWDDAVKENSYSFGCENGDFTEIAEREKVKLRNALLEDLDEIERLKRVQKGVQKDFFERGEEYE